MAFSEYKIILNKIDKKLRDFSVENTKNSKFHKAVKVSVIIPVYNVEQYLRECLDSAVNQTFKDIEIICIDDGSCDNSLEILKEYERNDNRITVLSQENRGGGAARNRGLRVARGEYLAFLDGDDFYSPDYIEKMHSCALKTNSDIVVCACKRFNNNTKTAEDMPRSLCEEYLPEKAVFNYLDMPNYIFNAFQNWNFNKLFRHKFIKDNGIEFQEIFRTNDLYFTCCALVLAQRISTVKEPLIYYRTGIVSCQSTNYCYPTDFFKAFKALRKFLIKKGIYNQVEESYVNWAISACYYNINSIKADTGKRDVIYKTLNKDFKSIGITKKTASLIITKCKMSERKKFIQNIFSIRNEQSRNGNIYKVFCLFGIKIKVKHGGKRRRKEKNYD